MSSAPYFGGGVGAGVAEAEGRGEELGEATGLGEARTEPDGPVASDASPTGAKPPLASVKMRASSTMTIPARARISPMSHGTACSAVVGRRRSPQRRVSQGWSTPGTGTGSGESGSGEAASAPSASDAGSSSRSWAGQSGPPPGWAGSSIGSRGSSGPGPLIRPPRSMTGSPADDSEGRPAETAIAGWPGQPG